MFSASIIRTLCGLIAAIAAAIAIAAGDHGSAEEAKAMVNKAIAHIQSVGPDKAYKDFMEDPSWRDRDLYVFVGTFGGERKGTLLAHGANPKMVGKQFAGIKDADGKEIRIAQSAEEKGEGWFEYRWSNPNTKKIDQKATFFKVVPNSTTYVAVGIYK